MKIRQVSGCVVYRILAGAIEVMLLSKDDGTWLHPKGGVELDLSPRESAAKEVYEEAGVIGKAGADLGSFQFMKHGVVQDVQLFALRAEQVLDNYPEKGLRNRRWFSGKDALKVLDRYQAVPLFRLINLAEEQLAHEARKAKKEKQ